MSTITEKEFDQKLEALKADFIKVCDLAGIAVKPTDIGVLAHSPGDEHRDTARQREFIKNKSAVYVFIGRKNNFCYKVGKANKKSAPRVLSHHYSPSRANSTLAASLINDTSIEVDPDRIEEWIKNTTEKNNFLSKP
jgi:pSer/pThr/pTyr-binding forkhead associated (FHA) protein